MPAFVEKYSDAQREAVAHAYEDRKIRPYRRVIELAAAGELEHNGQRLEPFTMPPSYVADLVRQLRKRRKGQQTSQLAAQPPRDAIEALRRRLVNLADRELAHEEKRKPGDVNPEKMRQIVRVVRELAALPGPGDPRPAAPGQSQQGKRDGGETRGGMAGELLRSHRKATQGQAPTAPETHAEKNGTRQTGSAQSEDQTATHEQQNDQTDAQPGSRAHPAFAAAGVDA